MEQVEAPVARKPLWRRIVDFPLVAMLVAIVLVFLTSALAAFIADKVPPIAGFTANMRFGLILRCHARPRLRARHPPGSASIRATITAIPKALRHLLLGLGAGFCCFSRSRWRLPPRSESTGSPGTATSADLLPALIGSAIFPGGLGGAAVPRHPVPLDRGVRRQLGGAAADLGLLRRRASLQSQRQLRSPRSGLRSRPG